jgi:hypothetical protein
MAPRVLDLHEEKPDVVVVPVLDRRIDQRIGQAGVGDEPLADAPRGVLLDVGGPLLALGLAGAEDEDGPTTQSAPRTKKFSPNSKPRGF